MRRDVRIPSEGIECAAGYYIPDHLKPGEKRPVIVMGHGLSGTRSTDGTRPREATRKAAPLVGAAFIQFCFIRLPPLPCS
jgi:hypothetical protein